MKKRLVVLTGAGISAESGIKTFRATDGLWEGYNVMDVATPEAWQHNPTLVQEFYNQRRKQVVNAQPNKAHVALAKMQEYFDVQIITQNIDDLHERAGSRKVIHLHGIITYAQSSQNANLIYPIKGDILSGQLCELGSQLRSHVVWFGEAVPKIPLAMAICQNADFFILVGSSLAVYPAASLIDDVPQHVPKYIIDPKIPAISYYQTIIKIEKAATVGVVQVAKLLVNALN